MEFACILSGGVGSRLWPKSRKSHPKQFLKLFGNKSFLEMTYERLKDIVSTDRIYIVTHADYKNQAKLLLPQIRDENIIIEPERKETLACIALVAVHLIKKDPEVVLGVFPSDHYISNLERFRRCIKKGYELAKKGHMVCFGIKPTRIETNYGYIKKGSMIEESIYNVERFFEKPDIKRAKYFFENGYLWNSGIYIFKVSVFLKEIKKYLPNYHNAFMNLYSAISKDSYIDVLKNEYRLLDKISIDKGIMEKTKSLFVCESDFEWDDVGTWSAFERIMGKDSNGNVVKADAVLNNTQNCIVFSDKFVITVGIKDIIVVSVDDAILICHKSKDREIKDIIQNITMSEKYNKFL